MTKDKPGNNLRVGDVVQLRVRGTIRQISGEHVRVALHYIDGSDGTILFRAKDLTNLSTAREIDEEEAKRLLDDEL